MSYDLSIGRWTTEDPIEFKGGDVNLYRYVGNSPTNATDSTGLAGDQRTAPLPTGLATPTATDSRNTPSGNTIGYFFDYWLTLANYRERIIQ